MPKKKPSPKRKTAPKIDPLLSLLDFAKHTSAIQHLDELLDRLVTEAQAILLADRVSIFLLDPVNKIFWSKVAQGLTERIVVPMHQGIVGKTFHLRRLINIKEAHDDPDFHCDYDLKTGYFTHSLLSCPMINLKGDQLGVFQALNKRGGGAFIKKDEEVIQFIAGLAAIAVENARLYEQLEEAARDTILRLAAAAEFKDADTGSHLIRMSRYSRLIAEKMGFPEEFCRRIELASPMHDIGKLGVPDAILHKPGKLSSDEWVEMKKHPFYGAQILDHSHNELIVMSRNIALTHHEWFDGSGYPRGLKGEEIPIEGRIVSVADAFDALSTRRSYKEKFSLDETLKILDDGRNTHFDPAVLDAFYANLEAILKVQMSFESL